ncbi:AraC family transcriptional regulator [Lacibacter luteus]|uniref:AraC family transcriptional regulator n=1 Tax=Lacibacter luteus TaxID=2508719 RepID=A0A4Q1CKC3_9BACT|nr:helix-turn-helix domain-containing protein [Lacibacter luteus]RXK60792.1 AraC family transcriptional regulator [Lacibacter luteus]
MSGLMNYRQYVPSQELQSFVRYFWSFDATLPEASHIFIKSFADRFPRLIFQNTTEHSSIHSVTGDVLPDCYISGADTTHTLAKMGNSFSHFGISFQPHALHWLFGIDAAELTNQMPSLTDLCHTRLTQQLAAAKNHRERIILTTAFLQEKLSKQHIYSWIPEYMNTNTGAEENSLSYLHKQYRYSERQLERSFKSATGLSFGKFQRICRFEKALQLLSSSTYSELTSLAFDLDFTDQSHFIKEFRSFAGVTPYSFIKQKNIGSESSSFLYTA